MKRASLYFTAPGQVEVREEELAPPEAGQVLVQTASSAVSAGTELLAYRGSIPQDMALDASIAVLGGGTHYPFRYGYACVGEVVALGAGVDSGWLGRRVFAFNPHESAFCAPLGALQPVPEDLPLEDALFLPNMETAVNFVQDGRPLLGEGVAVFGLGIVGLLTTALLRRFPLGALVAFDRIERRRSQAQVLGVTACLDPAAPGALEQAAQVLQAAGAPDGADLLFEVSGSPAALDQAVQLAGFAARIVIGSWYAGKPVSLDLGGKFHRSRVQLVSSQVSTLAPQLTARWSKARRFAAAWDGIRQVRPARWITQRVPFAQAAQAYRLLAEAPEDTIQVVLEYRT